MEGQGWTEAEMLLPGQTLTTADGQAVMVLGVTKQAHPEGLIVYNIQVEGGHTYFVDDGLGDIAAIWVHNKKRSRKAFRDLAAWRQEYNLGAAGTAAADGKEYVLARLDIHGHRSFYGVNWDMRYPRPAGVTGQFLRHAEGDALSQAARSGLLRGARATLYVDKTPCRFCRNSFANFAKLHGIKELRVVTLKGVLGKYP